MDIDTGITEQDRKGVSEALARLLADTYALYLRTQKYHWNVVGSRFRELHLMFEEEYRELAEATDQIAERKWRRLCRGRERTPARLRIRMNARDTPPGRHGREPSMTGLNTKAWSGSGTLAAAARSLLRSR